MSGLDPIRFTKGKNFHANAIELESAGILITGASGSGKTSLAHGLIEQFTRQDRTAHWISDDQVLLELRKDSLFAIAPPAISGKAELFGLGIINVPFVSETCLALMVSLVRDETIERMPEERFTEFICETTGEKIQLPLIEVPLRHEVQAVRLVIAKLGQLERLPKARSL